MCVSHDGKRIWQVVRVRPNCPAQSFRKPSDTASSSGDDTQSAQTSVDGTLSGADGLYLSENIPAPETACKLCAAICNYGVWDAPLEENLYNDKPCQYHRVNILPAW